jgi:hypothetical protein
MVRSLALVFALFSLAASAEPLTLTAEDWAHPRGGAALAQQPTLIALLERLERERDGVVVIGHATGEAGQLWAEELRGWLIALGVASSRIRFDARPALQGALALDVRPREEL